jgi:hypothetical protein
MELLNPLSIARSLELFPGKAFKATCPASLVVGKCVYIAGPKVGDYYQVAQADPSDILKMPAIGVVTEKADATHCTVQCLGEVSGIYSGLTIPKPLFVSLLGDLSAAPPDPLPAGYAMAQVMGATMSPGDVLLCPNFFMTKRIG